VRPDGVSGNVKVVVCPWVGSRECPRTLNERGGIWVGRGVGVDGSEVKVAVGDDVKGGAEGVSVAVLIIGSGFPHPLNNPRRSTMRI